VGCRCRLGLDDSLFYKVWSTGFTRSSDVL
jgi:hypothetical protein